MSELSQMDRTILRALSRPFPEGLHPYREIAEHAGVSEDEVLRGIQDLLDRGIIRRMAAIAHDAKLGYKGNAMVAWRVSEDDLERAGMAAACRPEISHAYSRRTTPDWQYNLYTMIHAHSRDESMALVEQLAPAIGATEYRILFSRRELTKRPPSYEKMWD